MKNKILKKDWDVLNQALACASVAVTDTWNAQMHPEWAGEVEAGRRTLVERFEIAEEGN